MRVPFSASGDDFSGRPSSRKYAVGQSAYRAAFDALGAISLLIDFM
jgi:hypothetical protein